MDIQTLQVIPVLRMFDIAKATEFYVGWLGCSIDWEHRFGDNFPLYMQVSGHGFTLHLTEHYGDCTPGAKVFIRITGIDALLKKLHEVDYRFYKPAIEEAPWNARTLEIIDPFGNKLLFSEDKGIE